MLISLQVRQFAIIDQAEIVFAEGMTALTGETGAGKSLLVDALLLLSGARSDSGFVKHGADRAEIVAQFDLRKVPKARGWLHQHELDQGNECLIRRVIRADGNNKSWLNGTPVTLSNLAELAACLIEIHGQHEAYALLQRGPQLELLDAFAAHPKLLQQTRDAFNQWAALDVRIRDAEQQDLRDEHLALLRHEADELARDAPNSELIESLFAKHKRLSHHGELIEGASRLAGLFEGEDGASLLQTLSNAQNEAQRLLTLDPSLSTINELLESARIQVDEAQSILDRYRDMQEIDPQEFSDLEARLTRLHTLARKHRVSMQGLAEKAASLEQQANALEQARSSLDAWRAELLLAEKTYRDAAQNLSRSRIQAARTLSRDASKLMQSLAMEGGKFEITLTHESQRAPSLLGNDGVDFLVSANPGQPTKPLRKVASGGELARISLALEVAAQGRDPVPTLVFDEVDTGIGGAVAESVGKQLRILGAARQVLCVTHLAQVAAQAHAQVSARKSTSNKTVMTEFFMLNSVDRVEEIARMLGGETITSATRANAQSLLDSAQTSI